MSKINVVYIGTKPQKRITQMGKKLLFPQGVPVAIEDEVAYNLLDYPDVFATEENAKDRVKALKAAAAEEAKRKEEIEKMQAKETADLSWLVIVDGEERDISKYTSAKIKTIIEVEDLEIKTSDVELKDMREAVRVALHAKHGNPADKA